MACRHRISKAKGHHVYVCTKCGYRPSMERYVMRYLMFTLAGLIVLGVITELVY